MTDEVRSIQGQNPKEDSSENLDSNSLLNRIAFIAPLIKKFNNNKKLFIALIAAVLVLVILFVVLILALVLKKDDNEQPQPPQVAQKQLSNEEIQKLADVEITLPQVQPSVSNVDNLIIKGNLLYKQGQHQEAFNILNKVANFSQSVATYNLGTMQLNNKLYEDALNAYTQSIQTGQNVPVSAINAAVASYYLKRFDLYDNFLNLTKQSLGESTNEPFYSYVYALDQYYKDHYFEALSPLVNPSSKDFEAQNAMLAAKLFALFGDDSNALKYIKDSTNPNDYKSIGLLYARVGDYNNARAFLLKHLKNNSSDVEAIMAVQIVDLKLGNYELAATTLEHIVEHPALSDIAQKTYPIKIVINPEIFDVSLAQKSFWERDFEKKDKLGYKILFYFAPYKVFDAKAAMKEIIKGGYAKHINITEGKNTLLRSVTTSKIDKQIIQSLIKLETKDLRAALAYLKSAAQKNPNHAVLYYNLGLVNAQLGFYDEAYSYFIRSYYLDQSDYLSGIFAVLCGKFNRKNTDRIAQEMLRNVQSETFSSPSQSAFINNFLKYISDSPIQDNAWINKTKDKEAIFYALDFANALRAKNKQLMMRAMESLRGMYADDVVVNVMLMLSQHFGENLQRLALGMYHTLKNQQLDLRSLYYGGEVARELYVYVGFITGFLEHQVRQMQEHLIAQDINPNGTLQTLGLIYLYQQDFQKAYTIYNTLLDELGENDGYTRFLTAVSAVGAGNYADAVLLLQLTKMESPTIYEARYALGLLYQANQNLKSAASNYRFISSGDFKSEFFDFQIDGDKIYAYELEDIQKDEKEKNKTKHIKTNRPIVPIN